MVVTRNALTLREDLLPFVSALLVDAIELFVQDWLDDATEVGGTHRNSAHNQTLLDHKAKQSVVSASAKVFKKAADLRDCGRQEFIHDPLSLVSSFIGYVLMLRNLNLADNVGVTERIVRAGGDTDETHLCISGRRRRIQHSGTQTSGQ